MEDYILSIDIGGSKLLVGIINKKGDIIETRKALFVNPKAESVVDMIISECRSLLDNGYKVQYAGISIPGLADAKTGRWLYACFSKIENLPLVDILKKEFGFDFYLENDANICAFGEKIFGCAKEFEDFMWITVSNGIGSGIFLKNHLFSGSNGNAGEIGHIKVVDDGEVCPCGGHGCLEAYAAGSAIARRYREKKQYDGPLLLAKDIAMRAQSGEIEAIEVFEETGFYLGKAIASANNIINTPLAVIGGGVAMSFSLFEKGIQSALEKNMYVKANPKFEVKKTELGYEACLIGAAAYAMYCNSNQSI